MLFLRGLLLKFFGIEENDHQLCLAQYSVISSHAPLFYLVMVSGMVAIAYVSFSVASPELTIVMPIVMLIGFLVFFNSLVIPKNVSVNDRRKSIVLRLQGAVWGLTVLGLIFSYWAISIFQSGGVSEQSSIIQILGISTIGAAVCLMQFRAAALALLVFTLSPFFVNLLINGDRSHLALFSITALVAAVFIAVAYRYGNDFSEKTAQNTKIENQKNDAERLSQTNRMLAASDSLTSLANRRAFLETLESKFGDIRAQKFTSLAVGILDVDGFKQVNDVYGHKTGDELLQAVAKRILHLLRGQAFLARLGGDEFGLIFSGSQSRAELEEYGARICEAMRVPFELGDFSTRLGGSVGLSMWDKNVASSDKLFEQADYALYYAKENVLGGTVIFDEHHASTIQQVSGVDRRMLDASFEDEMSLVFQPIVESEFGTVVGFEALARWENPVLGKISPELFIRSAEKAGTINKLTSILLGKALKEAESWPHNVFLSFNLSMQDITSEKAILKLVSIINKSTFSPKLITFEVTETSMMHDYERALASLNLLKSLGCRIALDDFGTGYSSLAYVQQMPLDKVKLDRAFIANIETDEDSAIIARSMIQLCEQLNLECIVEGVETIGQYDVLMSMGCTLIQGYYFSRPLESVDALCFLAENTAVEQADNSTFVKTSIAAVS